MKTCIAWAFVLVCAFSVSTDAATITYNAVNDFAADTNPNGAWSYGYALDSQGPSGFTPYTNHTKATGLAFSNTDIDFWTMQRGVGIPI